MQATDVTQIVADAPALERSYSHLNAEEHALIRELLRPGASIDAAIPDDADPQTLWRTRDACVRGLALLETRICRLKPIIGRILTMFERKPSLYKELGYNTFGDFMQRGVYAILKLHTTSAYEARMLAKDWPQLTPDRYAKIGPKNLNILSKFATGKDSNAEMLLEAAERMTVKELKEYVEQRGFIEPGETTHAIITIHTNQDVLSYFKEVFNDGRVHSVVGSKDHGVILKSMMQECHGEWIDKYDRRRRTEIEAETCD